jgi:tetratricopeptide (TPR) repeat protein
MRLTLRPLVPVVVVLCTLLDASAARPAALAEVARLFLAGQYAQARALDPANVASGRHGEGALWGMQLAGDPRQALRLARDLAGDDHLPQAGRVRAAVDAATIALAQGRPAAALEFLQPLTKDDRGRAVVPGEVHLLAGIAARALRMNSQASQDFGLVGADDPAYGAAQYQLGRLALDAGEFERAAEAFQTAAAVAGGTDPLADAGRWQALRRLGRAAEALTLAQKILRRAPASLAAMEVRATLAREGQAGPVALPPDLPAGEPPAPAAVALTIELARFDDRAEALVFAAKWRPEVPGLEVIEAGDAFAVVAGDYGTREEAEQAADVLRDTHDLRGRIVEREGR